MFPLKPSRTEPRGSMLHIKGSRIDPRGSRLSLKGSRKPTFQPVLLGNEMVIDEMGLPGRGELPAASELHLSC